MADVSQQQQIEHMQRRILDLEEQLRQAARVASDIREQLEQLQQNKRDDAELQRQEGVRWRRTDERPPI